MGRGKSDFGLRVDASHGAKRIGAGHQATATAASFGK